MWRGRSIAVKGVCSSKVCPWRLAQQRPRLTIAVLILFTLRSDRMVNMRPNKSRNSGDEQRPSKGRLTAEVLMVIVGARGRRAAYGGGGDV